MGPSWNSPQPLKAILGTTQVASDGSVGVGLDLNLLPAA
jgi:hypothetical protein